MPMYEFLCEECGHKFSELCSINEDLSRIGCPICGKARTRKLLSAFSSVARNDRAGCRLGSPQQACAGCPGQHRH